MISSAITLVELLIVIAIVGTLAAIGVPAYNNYIDKARNEQAIEDIHFIEAAIKKYQTEYGTLPDTLSQVPSAQLLDPWGNPYQYLNIEALDKYQDKIMLGKKMEKDKDKRKTREDRFLAMLNIDFFTYKLWSTKDEDEDKGESKGKPRKDRFLVPINTDFDLYSMGKDGRSEQNLDAHYSRDDIVRANDGLFVGLAIEY
jgi:general secretion pathway protein G